MSFLKKVKGEFKDLAGHKAKESNDSNSGHQDKAQDTGRSMAFNASYISLTDTAQHAAKGAADSYYRQPASQTSQLSQNQYDQHSLAQQYDQIRGSYYSQQPPSSPQDHYGNSSQGQGPQLPPGWLQQWDPNSQRYYYLEQVTGRSQWDLPTGQSRGSGTGYPGSDGQGYNQPQSCGQAPSSYHPNQGQSYNPSSQSYNQGYPPAQGQGYNQQSYGYDQYDRQSSQGYPPTQGQNYHQQSYSQGPANPQQSQHYPPPVAVSHPGGPNYPVEAVASGEKKKKDNHLDALVAGAGGLLIGGLAGAAISRHSSHHDGKQTPAASITLFISSISIILTTMQNPNTKAQVTEVPLKKPTAASSLVSFKAPPTAARHTHPPIHLPI